jgi:hypothetical protein
MITGIRIDKVEASREKMSEIKGLDINISIDNVKVMGPEVQVDFTYIATYPDRPGLLVFKGRANDREQKMLMSYIAEVALQAGRLPGSAKLERWDVGPSIVEAEIAFVGHPSSPLNEKGTSIRFRCGISNEEQRQLAMEIKEQLSLGKSDAASVISIRSASLVGNDATLEISPSPVGVLKMKGSLLSHEEQKAADSIRAGWESEKKLPDQFSELVLNAINFTCGTNGVLVVRPVNLAPPMMPPRISISHEEGEKQQGKEGKAK